ncbi:hypothetical protein [Nostoc sp. CMAA1605]|uniref:hypothetical protein n=1 Tax=Nostoc sp. CMAA1605 TaxID=2055159 RepID=UPI001F3E0F71|nr:hypothetical protein [Nostoc sp. CMAA1605]MCF4970503.1 hypothetical protein [Nostoc sp. CMAA1605]
MLKILKVNQNTTFKDKWSFLGSSLTEEDRFNAKQGDLFSVKKVDDFDDSKEENSETGMNKKQHWYVQFEKPLNGKESWYVFKDHVELWSFGEKLK